MTDPLLAALFDRLPASGERFACRALVVLEQHPDGTSLVAPADGGLAAWVPTHLLAAHRLPDPLLP